MFAASTVPDPDHSLDEERFITVGWSNRRRLLMVSHTDRGNRIRIISARELTKLERNEYEETN
ncbi:MAG: BrnT family toxin [Chloroflexi bacterium]|nr:BrnT family toxin [Chloroflexota bacterium]